MAEESQSAAHASSDVHVAGIVCGGVAIAVGIMLVTIAAWFLWQRWGAPSGAKPFGGPNAGNVPQAATPALQSAPQLDRAQYFNEKRKLTDSWEWIDRQRGIARIPVEEAMRIMAGRNGGAGAAQKEPG
ncbi:MAG TPA: hypothetical protein VF450_21770 [Noviherbaspirillum sp.]